jgi:homoserine dehydrogenase
MQTEGSDFTDVLADAQQLGYAEADPTADVDGLDAADKIAILASLAFGGRIKLQDVYCEGIRKVSGADIAYAEKLDFVIKLLAIAKRDTPPAPVLSVRVHPTLVPKAHPLASVNGVYNAILVEGEPIGQVMFFGPGAGAGATASAVVSDILNIAAVLKTEQTSNQDLSQSKIQNPKSKIATLHPLLACSHQHYCANPNGQAFLGIAPMEELVTRFYARFLTQDRPGVIGKLGTCFGNHGVSLESVVQTGVQEQLAEIVVVTHDVREGNFRQALAEIHSLEAVDSIPSLLRVL